jgi:hypothetical protein
MYVCGTLLFASWRKLIENLHVLWWCSLCTTCRVCAISILIYYSIMTNSCQLCWYFLNGVYKYWHFINDLKVIHVLQIRHKVFIYLSVFLRNNKTKNVYSSPDLYRQCWSKTENDYCLAKVITSKPKKPLRDPQLSNGKAIIRLFWSFTKIPILPSNFEIQHS